MGDVIERANALLEAGADVLVVDVAHGHADAVLEVVRALKQKLPDVDVIAGNVATAQGAADLIDVPHAAELFYYNVDGIGSDGSQYPAWTDGVQVRACATGHRWTLVEMPPPPPGKGPDAPLTQADVLLEAVNLAGSAEQYVTQGFVLVKNLITTDEAAAYRTESHRLLTALGGQDDPTWASARSVAGDQPTRLMMVTVTPSGEWDRRTRSRRPRQE